MSRIPVSPDEGRLPGRLCPSPHVVAAVHGEVTVLLDPMAERYFSLTGVGGTIWSLLEDEPTVEELVTSLSARFDHVERPQLTGDVSGFLSELLQHGLIESARA
jgi:hypothetical protein